MSQRIDAPRALAAGSRRADLFAWLDSSGGDFIDEVNRLVEEMGRNRQFLEQVAEFKNTTLVLSATDTGRELMIAFDEQGIRAGPYDGQPFDVKIQATEEVHRAVLVGEMDADAAFFARKIRIRGSLVTAFRIKNRFLSLLQWHLAREFQATDKHTATMPRER